MRDGGGAEHTSSEGEKHENFLHNSTVQEHNEHTLG